MSRIDSTLMKTCRAWSGVLLALCLCSCALQSASVPPQRTELSGRPNSIAVRPGDGAVFITDDTSNAILSSTDGRSFTRYATLPAAAGQPNSLSQLVFADDHTLLVARFGFGSAGAVFDLAPPAPATQLSGLDPARRRLGLAVLAPGEALSTWVVKRGSGPSQGGVSLITYDVARHVATERDLLIGLGKPVGVVVSGDTVFVADQEANTIVKASLSELMKAAAPATTATVFVRIDGPDLLAIDHNGSLYTKCHQHGLCSIARDGSVAVMAEDFHSVRGVAVDHARNRLYVIDRAGDGAETSAVRWFVLHSPRP